VEGLFEALVSSWTSWFNVIATSISLPVGNERPPIILTFFYEVELISSAWTMFRDVKTFP
jgi:hypothetical protein